MRNAERRGKATSKPHWGEGRRMNEECRKEVEDECESD
jgi:hypothetical protein